MLCSSAAVYKNIEKILHNNKELISSLSYATLPAAAARAAAARSP